MEVSKETKFVTKVAYGMTMTLELRIHACKVQRKRAMPHSTIKNNRDIIRVVITLTMGRHVSGNKHALALWTSVTLFTLLV